MHILPRGAAATGIVAATLALSPSVSSAIVVSDSGTPSDLPNPTWYARFDSDRTDAQGGNASAVVVGPNLILTTRHQTSGATSPNAGFTIPQGANAGSYKVVSETSWGASVDLRLFQVSNLDDSPVNFATFPSIFTGSYSGQQVAIGGYGRQIGAALAGGTGFSLTSAPGDNSYSLLQGYNRVMMADLDGMSQFAPYASTPMIVSDYDGPSGGGLDAAFKLDFEATIAEFDSGGGWFAKNGANWELIGISVAVSTPTTADYGDMIYAAYVTPFASQVPEPAMLGLVAPCAAIALRRRKSRG